MARTGVEKRKEKTVHRNVTLIPIDNDAFVKSMTHASGIITGAGFETPAEALYLNKKLISIPIKNHYEQQCNAAALEKMGVSVLEDVDEQFADIVEKWYTQKNTNPIVKANNINETLQLMMDTYPTKNYY
jgi:uncharacterized protein (TIGR00661 family)